MPAAVAQHHRADAIAVDRGLEIGAPAGDDVDEAERLGVRATADVDHADLDAVVATRDVDRRELEPGDVAGDVHPARDLRRCATRHGDCAGDLDFRVLRDRGRARDLEVGAFAMAAAPAICAPVE